MTATPEPFTTTPAPSVPLTAVAGWHSRLCRLADDVEIGGLSTRAIANALRAMAGDLRTAHQRATNGESR